MNEHPIDIPAPPVRDRGLLIDALVELTGVADGDQWRAGHGVEWLPWGPIDVTVEAASLFDEYDKQPTGLPDLVTQRAFLIWKSMRRAAAEPISTLLQRVHSALDSPVLLSAWMARELESAQSAGIDLTGSAAHPPTFAAATGVSLHKALIRIEAALTEHQPNVRGIIHLTPGLYGQAAADGLIVGDGVKHTHTGHLVVGDAGHTGKATPHGGSAAGTDEMWIYATTQVYYALGPIRGVTATGADMPVNAMVNEYRPLGERLGILVFDPAVMIAAKVAF